MAIAIADHLISKGLKQEDVSKVVTEMSSYYNRLHAIGNKVTACDSCSLRRACNKAPITGLGPLRPEIMVVSDYPLNDEGSTGMIEASVFMMTLFSRIGLKMEDIYWTHAVKCRTDRVKMSQIRECYQHIHSEVVSLQPAVIIALGTTAISSLAGEHVSITDAFGKEFEFDAGNKDIPVIPLFHPRWMMDLRDGDFKKRMNEMWTQVQEISDYL